MKTALVVMMVLSSGIAAAQPAPDPGSPPDGAAPAITTPRSGAAVAGLGANQAPGFVVIERLDASSRAGIDISYIRLNTHGSTGDRPTLLRFEGHAHYVDKASGFGGYVQVPLAYASASTGTGTSTTITDVGDLEVGGIFIPKLSIPEISLVLHAGITTPTGENDTEAGIGIIESALALPELYNALPKGVTGKFGVSPIVRSGSLFARLDVGLDWNFHANGVTAGKGIHYNLGVGVDLGKVAVMLESENLTIMDETDANGNTGSGGTLNAAAVSARADAGMVSPYLAVVIPIEHDTSDLVDLAVVVGADFKIP